jgi:S1-C subfamily serine protease
MKRTFVGAAILALLATACAGSSGPWFTPQGATAPLPSVAPPSPLPPFNTHEDRIVQVVRRVSPAVVSVTSTFECLQLTGQAVEQQGEGTGFIVDGGGVIVTNFHVIEAPESCQLRSIQVVTADGTKVEARLIGGDADADVGVLQADVNGQLPTVELGSSKELELGEPVVALGFALGLAGGPSVTSGIVSAKDRSIRAGGEGSPTRTYEDLIQTDAAINPGNSGGPLVDLAGKVIGMNTAGVQASSAENIGFAISIDRARPIIDEAISDPAAPQAYMGISSREVTPAVAAQLDLATTSGALVLEVVAGSPSDRAGIAVGDVIVEIAGQEIDSPDAIGEVLADHDPDEQVPVVVVTPDGSRQTFTVTLGTRLLPVGQG